jgi:flagellar motor switch protein FliM
VTEQLTDSQIGALFEAERDGRLPDSPIRRNRGPRVTPIDFSRPSTFSKEQERQMRRIHEAFSRTATTALAGETHASIDMEVIGISQVAWAGAISEAGSDQIWALIELEPLGTRVAMTLERLFVLTLVERLCGGSAAHQLPGSDRRLSEIDMTLARRVFAILVDQLSFVWKDSVGVDLAFTDLELDSPATQIASPAEPALVASIEVWVDQRSFVLRVMVPHASISEARGRFTETDADRSSSDPESRRHMQDALGPVDIEVRAGVASIDLTAAELLAIQVGDVVKLGPAGPVTLYADGVALHRAEPGSKGSHRAVQIVGRRLK